MIDEAQEGSKEERAQFQQMMASSRHLPALLMALSSGRSHVLHGHNWTRNITKQSYAAGYVVVSKIDDKFPTMRLLPLLSRSLIEESAFSGRQCH
jgi:hypothetical protein